jgi:hypothetical protein
VPSPQAEHHRVASARDAGLAAFAATTGALLMLGRTRGGSLFAFADVGRHVMREIYLPYWGDVVVGMAIHLGEMTLLGVAVTAVLAGWRAHARWRSAGIVVFAPFALVRADVAAGLSVRIQFGIAVLLVTALALGTRKD